MSNDPFCSSLYSSTLNGSVSCGSRSGGASGVSSGRSALVAAALCSWRSFLIS